jgi:hypothetical protein
VALEITKAWKKIVSEGPIVKSFVLNISLLMFILFTSCAGKINRFEEGSIMSNELYSDLYYQVHYALMKNSKDTDRAEKLEFINQKLEEYRADYDSFQKILTSWRNSGRKPDDIMQSYKKMWYSLLEAQSLAAKSYIYASECSARTAIKGKAGSDCP